MKIQVGRVADEIERNGVLGIDRQRANAVSAGPRHTHLLGGERNIVIAGNLDNRRANVLFGAGAVGRLGGFGLHGILEFEVREERRDELAAYKDCQSDDGKAGDQFQCRHKKQIAQSLVANFMPRISCREYLAASFNCDFPRRAKSEVRSFLTASRTRSLAQSVEILGYG